MTQGCSGKKIPVLKPASAARLVVSLLWGSVCLHRQVTIAARTMQVTHLASGYISYLPRRTNELRSKRDDGNKDCGDRTSEGGSALSSAQQRWSYLINLINKVACQRRATGTRQGSLCKHIRHIRHQFGICKVQWLVGMCCCCRVNLLADGFLTQILSRPESALNDQPVVYTHTALPRVTQC